MLEGEEIVEFPKVDDPTYTQKSEKIEEKTPEEKLEEVPNVVGMDISQAKAVLSKYNLTIYYEYSATVPKNIVISQSVSDGRVVLRVSKGGSR